MNIDRRQKHFELQRRNYWRSDCHIKSYIGHCHFFTIINTRNCSFPLRDDVVIHDVVGKQTKFYREVMLGISTGIALNWMKLFSKMFGLLSHWSCYICIYICCINHLIATTTFLILWPFQIWKMSWYGILNVYLYRYFAQHVQLQMHINMRLENY